MLGTLAWTVIHLSGAYDSRRKRQRDAGLKILTRFNFAGQAKITVISPGPISHIGVTNDVRVSRWI